MIDLNTYPDLRYLRHETDYPGESTNEAIERALQILDEIRLHLQRDAVIMTGATLLKSLRSVGEVTKNFAYPYVRVGVTSQLFAGRSEFRARRSPRKSTWHINRRTAKDSPKFPIFAPTS